MHTHSLAQYIDCIERDDWLGVGELMLSSAHRLAAAGASFLISPDNTIHQAFTYVEPRSPLPWIHIVDAVIAHAVERGFRRVGLMGTRRLVDSGIYPDRLAQRGIEAVRPTDAERESIDRIIFDELVKGIVTVEALKCFQLAIERFARERCDSVILGCTEIPLIVNDANSALPTLDSTRLLACAALRRAVGAPATARAPHTLQIFD